MANKKCKILILDKKEKHASLFYGLRKNKFSISQMKTIMKLTDFEFAEFDFFLIVLYEYKDLLELLKVYNKNIPIIIGSENLKVLKKVKVLDSFPVFDLSGKVNNMVRMSDCFKQFFY
jgi:hypothetical protein